ncbi:MAG: ethylbenzene dehydrogenase-related protein [Gammaproteobacteria bacterium]|nr:ethylbenzene dehydrogenase-related protein [Gammaproteobacteria bacterium]
MTQQLSAPPKKHWRSAAAGMLFVLGASGAPPALAVDWSGIPTTEIVLFYAGQSSWEWALTQSDHSGNEKFRSGKDCKKCHQTEEKDIGAKIVSGEKLEPDPIAGKPGSLPVKIQTVHDGARLYARFEWQAPDPTGTKMDADTAARVTMMLGDASVKEAARAGCWGTCHDDMIGMASAPSGGEITKYLAASRTKITRQGGGENYKSAADLQQFVDTGAYMEYWQAKLNPGSPAEPISGYVLDKRHQDEQPVVEATASNEGGKWTVVLSRKLKMGGKTHKDLEPGKTYYVGFAIHEDYTDHRFHYISLEHTLSLDQGTADLVAKK